MAAMIPSTYGANGQYSTQAAYAAAKQRKLVRDQARPVGSPGYIPTAPQPGTVQLNDPIPQYKTTLTDPALEARRQILLKEADRHGGIDKATGYQTKINQLYPTAAPVTPPAAVAPTPQPDPTPAPVAPEAPAPTFRTAYDFLPKSPEEDPIYKYQTDQGLHDLTGYLAAHGLRQSGARDSAAAKLIGQASADSASRAQTFAGNEADRYERTVQNESGRLERGGQNAFNNLLGVLQLGANQSPADAAYGATNTMAGNDVSQGNKLYQVLSSMYPKVSGGGGGGGGVAPYSPPFAAGPDFTKSNVAAIGANANSNAGWGNVLTSFLGGLFG